MTCASCAKERGNRKLDGVTKSSVNLATENLTIHYDASKVRVSDIKRAVERSGYKALEKHKDEDGIVRLRNVNPY